jgi:hypothetical protein
MGSSDEETDEITGQPAKKTKVVGGSAVANVKKAQPKPKKWGMTFVFDETSLTKRG